MYIILGDYSDEEELTTTTLLRILQVSDCKRRFSEQRVCTTWNVPAEQYVYHFDETLGFARKKASPKIEYLRY